MKKTLTLFFIVCIFYQSFADPKEPTTDYRNKDLSIEKRVEDLLSRMTLEEKFWQLYMIPGDLKDGKGKYKNGIFGLQVSTKGKSGGDADQMLDYHSFGSARSMVEKINSIQKFFVEETRLGIPIIPFDEALHGLIREGATAYPQSIALAATWDVQLMERIASAVAQETRSRGIRQILSPVVNIARDVRWGRVEETYGEDPYLSAQMGVAFVKSFENAGVITTPKHFVANVGDGGRDSYPIHFNERLLNEIYFPAFKACFQEGSAHSVMTSYNSLDGSPCTSNDWLLNKVLKEKWGFQGFVISDAGAVGGILDLHHTVNNREESAAQAINGGLDVIFQTAYDHHIPLLRAFQQGKINEANINRAVARVLTAKFHLGLFDNPYSNPNEAEKWNGHPEHRKLALEAAQKSIVLLKNDLAVLPLNKNIKSLAIIGKDAQEARLGGYSGPGNNVVSFLDGIKKKFEGTVHFVQGCGRDYKEFDSVPGKYLFHYEGRKKKQGLKAKYFDNIHLDGKPKINRVDNQIDFRWALFGPHHSLDKGWFSARWTGKFEAPNSDTYRIGIEGNDGYRLFINDKLVIDNWQKVSFSTKTISMDFKENQSYDIKIEFYESVGNSRIRLIWDAESRDEEMEIIEAIQTARLGDAVVVVAGIEEGEFRDRANLDLPGRQQEMILRIAEIGKPVIVLLIGGSAITMHDWINKVEAVLCAWYPGEQGGNALADILFGDINPGGKLPITFPRSVAQLPLYYNHKPTGRGDYYLDMEGKPLFPFGFGLSYTKFKYDNLKLSLSKIRANEEIRISFDVKNSEQHDGDEVVQLYLKDRVASVVRPVIELKRFKRITLSPNDILNISFTLNQEDFSFLDAKMNRVVEPGEFEIMIGSSSQDIRLKTVFEIVE